MKISYNWLKSLMPLNFSAERVAEMLTASGLEVEGMETFESIKGGLKGIVVGEVIEKEKHPDADRLSLTKVSVGGAELLSIVCGAKNVEVGQKVLIAMVGSTLYPSTGEPIQIKKSKIRGALSEGMICAEDEIGLGSSHEGIMVLDSTAIVGSNAADLFKIENDVVFEIGLTPNRSDAASHLGVARDLRAIIACHHPELNVELRLSGVNELPQASGIFKIDVVVEATELCKRYSGITISGISVKESPQWLKNRLSAIGLRPINNIVDITNFVLHETGQPLHAFDANKISGNKIKVRTANKNEKFTTLDGVERNLVETDLMIANENDSMCIAGVFGGLHSGVSESTNVVFIESAYFDAGAVRRSSKAHGLKTDASFRFERGTDPEITLDALKRATHLILEIAGGTVTSDVVDIYPNKIEPYKIGFSYQNCCDLIGKDIDRAIIKNIILALDIQIITEGADGLLLSVPAYRTDVQREVDVIEEVMRIYGYNNIEIPNLIRYSAVYATGKTPVVYENLIGNLLASNGFNEIMSTSLTKEKYFSEEDKKSAVEIVNPLSADLSYLRNSLLYSGLEAINYNQNRKHADLKLFEFGKAYSKSSVDGIVKYHEEKQLAIFITGRKLKENPYGFNSDVNYFQLKALVEMILRRLNIASYTIQETTSASLENEVSYLKGSKRLVTFGSVAAKKIKEFDIDADVFYANFNTDNLIKAEGTEKIIFEDVAKFPSVKRDLALLMDKSVNYSQLREIAFGVEKKLLREVNLFDIYEGDKIESGKKSYAVSFTLQNDEATMTDKQVEQIMQKLITAYSEKLGATLR